MAASFRVEMLGGFQVTSESTRITRFRTRQTTSLFAYLVLNRGKSIARETLAEMFWPEAADHDKARASLSVAISSLRGQLEKGQKGNILQVDVNSLGVFATMVESDVEVFEQALDAVGQDNTPEAIRALETALSLFKGTFLPGFYEDWVIQEQARLRDRFVAAVRRVGIYFEEDGNIDAAIYWRRQEVLFFPDDHDILAHLLVLLIEEDRLHEAATAYYTAKKHWPKKTKNPLPTSLLKRLEPILKNYPEKRPVQTRQRPPKLPAPLEQPPPALLMQLPALPRELARFVGREKELAQIRLFALSPENRVLTLVGLGGMGKTRLAIEAGHRLRDEGVATYFVRLQTARNEHEMLREIALSLQIPQASDPQVNLLEPIVYVLGSHPQVLLILDNLEQLVHTTALDCLTKLFYRVPKLHCLVTSQVRLSISGERTLPIEPLAVPSREAVLLGRTAPEAFEAAWPCIALFMDRARENVAEFQLHSGNIEIVARIVRRLAGMPLALLLVAARVQVMSLPEIWEGISASFKMVSTTRQTYPERHRSLEASISWSYGLLRDELKRFFVQLPVFQGSFGSADVTAVLQEPLAIDYLSELCDSSFLTNQIGEQQVRFVLLEPLRLFGNQQQEPAQREILRQQHAQHFAHVAEQSKEYWRTEREGKWLDRLKLDLENLRAAMTWSLESDDDTHLKAACLLGIGLSRFWWVSNLNQEGKVFLTQLLQKEYLTAHISLEQHVRLHNSLISQEVVSGNNEAVRIWGHRALALVEKLGDQSLKAVILANIGIMEFKHLEWKKNNPYISEALDILHSHQEYSRLITIYHNLGLECAKRGNLSNMLDFLKKEASISKKTKSSNDIGGSAQSLSNYLSLIGNYDLARNYYVKSMNIKIKNSNYFSTIGSLSCYFICIYIINKDIECLKKVSYILKYRSITGIEEGIVSKILLERHDIIVSDIEIPSLQVAYQTILGWATDVTANTDENYDTVIQDILEYL